MSRRGTPDDARGDTSDGAFDGAWRPFARAGLILGLVVAGFVAWLWMAPVSSAVLAQGRFKVEGEVKTVQHLEGGIVGELLVGNGDRVAAGDVLLRLDATEAKASHAAMQAEHDALLARRVRLEQQLSDRPAPALDFSTLEGRDRPTLAAAIASETAVFRAQTLELTAQQMTMEGSVERLERRLAAQTAELAALEDQRALVEADTQATRQLAESGTVSRSALNARERDLAGLTGSIASLRAQITETEAAQDEARLAHVQSQSARVSALSRDLAQVVAQLAEITPRLAAAGDRIRRTELRAPVAGEVVNLSLATIGGVLAPGAPVLDLVPADSRLTAEVRLDPKSREQLHVGMPAVLRLSGVRHRGESDLRGEIVLISAELTTDPEATSETSQRSYAMRIVLTEVPEDLRLEPGMPVTSVVATEARSAIDYLISPMRNALSQAMRED